MRRLSVVAVAAAVALFVPACGGSTASCEEIADEAIVLIQDLVDQVAAMSIDEILSAGDTFPGQAEFEAKGEELQEQADDANCTDAQMEELISARADRLESDSEFGRLIIESIRSEGFFSE